MCPGSIAGEPLSQAIPGYLITAPPSVCVPAVMGVLTVWIQQQKKEKPQVIKCKNHTLNLCYNPKYICYCPCVFFFIHRLFVYLRMQMSIFKQQSTKNKKLKLIAGVPSSQALPGYLITAPPSVCIPAVIGVLVVEIRNKTKKEQKKCENEPETHM